MGVVLPHENPEGLATEREQILHIAVGCFALTGNAPRPAADETQNTHTRARYARFMNKSHNSFFPRHNLGLHGRHRRQGLHERHREGEYREAVPHDHQLIVLMVQDCRLIICNLLFFCGHGTLCPYIWLLALKLLDAEDEVDEGGDIHDIDIIVAVHIARFIHINSAQNHVDECCDIAHIDFSIAVHVSLYVLSGKIARILGPTVDMCIFFVDVPVTQSGSSTADNRTAPMEHIG